MSHQVLCDLTVLTHPLSARLVSMLRRDTTTTPHIRNTPTLFVQSYRSTVIFCGMFRRWLPDLLLFQADGQSFFDLVPVLCLV